MRLWQGVSTQFTVEIEEKQQQKRTNENEKISDKYQFDVRKIKNENDAKVEKCSYVIAIDNVINWINTTFVISVVKYFWSE